RDDLLQQTLLAQPESRELVVRDGVDGDGGLSQPVRQRLLLRRKRLKAGRFDPDESKLVDARDQGGRRSSLRVSRRRRMAGNDGARKRAAKEGGVFEFHCPF